ncbi:MAG: protein kinase [Acidobacteria bacterium]|nr:protein kinase [Acidobacteriota bacterium]
MGQRLAMAVQILSHYEIVEQIAEGGMGIVYKARDTKLERVVALKLVSPSLRASSDLVEKLFQEARALSRLNHPNVATIYEVDDTAAEPFMAMEYMPGGTLTSRIRKAHNGNRVPAARIIEWAQQIAAGLAHAHRHGIIHRDVKPDNALFTEDGRLKITDFGVALVAGVSRNNDGDTTEGTAAYMSPEQAQGLEIDPRSDIFSLGVVLFEMATGTVPYAGQSAGAMIYDIINSPLPAFKPLADDMPAGFERIVRRALRKEPADRYDSLEDLLAELRAVREELRATTTSRHAARTPDPTIAVLPFVDMSPDRDQEYFCDGISEEIINALTTVKGLKVVSRTSSFGFKDHAYDIREIGEKLGVRTVLEGSVRKLGDRFRITVQHINVADGYHLWSQRFDREMKDVFAVQDEIAQAVVQTLSVKLTAQAAAVPQKRPHNVEAYNTYLQGRYHLNHRTRESLLKAIQCFEQTACEDCDFPLSFAGLAEAHILFGSGGYADSNTAESLEKAKQAAMRAISLDDSCAEAHTALALVHCRKDWNWAEADKEFRRGIDLNDGYATGHHQYALFLAQVKRLEEALQHVRRAHELDPLSLIISTAVGRILHFNRRYEEALHQFKRTIALDPLFAGTYFDLGITCGLLGRYEEALESLGNLSKLSSGEQLREWFTRAIIYAQMGEHDRAQRLVQDVLAAAGKREIPNFTRAILEMTLGHEDKAVEFLNQAYEAREAGLVYLQCEPFFDPMRNDPAYPALIKKMGFPDN